MLEGSMLAIVAICLSLVAGHAPAETGVLRVKAKPARAGVFLDGKYLGPAGRHGFVQKYAVAAGQHELRVIEPRFGPFVAQITIQKDEQTLVQARLDPLPAPRPPFGRIRVRHVDRKAAVYIDGKYMGHAGEFDGLVEGLKVHPGTYELKVVPLSAGSPVSRTITVEAYQTVVVR